MSAPGTFTSSTPTESESAALASSFEPIDGHALLGQLGSEVASALSAALERLNTLATTGKIGRKGLRELREYIELARRIGIMGQQVNRLAAGRVRQNVERVDLTVVLKEALLQHRRRIESLGFEVHQLLGPAQVMSDPTLMFTLLEALLEWSFEHARAAIDLRIELNGWPVFARLSSRFRFLSDEQVEHSLVSFSGPALQTMSWRLLQQAARTMELPISLEEDGAMAKLVIEFPRTVNDPSETSSLRDRSDVERQGLNSKPLAGSHLLVLAARRETRSVVRDAIRHMGLMVDYVTTIEEAREFCSGGMPHALLHESALGGERFERLRAELLTDMPHLVFIELVEDGQGLETRKIGGRQFSCVAHGSIIESLPPTLMFELSRPR
ncbi:MAG: hypothetical protein IPI03_17515 [Rubrivivax sp.]|nr:hypothetical protein [Rubrivivax sp.]MBK7263557.1 hypothetical protein [Rubrivivax sp.]